MSRQLTAPASRTLAITGVAVATVGVHVAAAAFFASHDPYTSTIFAPCPVLALTGLQCPGCGGTRAMYSLLHGDLGTAIAMNPLVMSMYPVALALGASHVVARDVRPRLGRALNWSALTLFAIAATYTVVIRNLPGF